MCHLFFQGDKAAVKRKQLRDIYAAKIQLFSEYTIIFQKKSDRHCCLSHFPKGS